MSYTLEFSKTSLADIAKHKKAGDIPTLKKIEKLLNELMKHPTTGTGQPEKLKYNLQGLYSRRINKGIGWFTLSMKKLLLYIY